MTNFIWKIQTLQRNIHPDDLDGGVITAVWECQGSEAEGDKQGQIGGVASFTPDLSAPDYVEYSNLTEDIVLGWCFAQSENGVPQIDKNQVEAQIQAQMDWFPTTENGVPW